jgi:Tol biopolymer transport system component
VPSKFSNIGGFDYSPDGASVFYAGDDPGDNRGRILRVRDLNTGQDSELARHVLELALSPDGRRLVYLFIDGKTRSQRLMIMPAAGGPARELTGAKEDEAISTFAWTRDSSQVIFAKCGGSEQQSTTKAMCGLWRVATEGGEPQRLGLTADGILRGLRVHPDGRRLAYGVWKFTGEIWVMENFLPAASGGQ